MDSGGMAGDSSVGGGLSGEDWGVGGGGGRVPSMTTNSDGQTYSSPSSTVVVDTSLGEEDKSSRHITQSLLSISIPVPSSCFLHRCLICSNSPFVPLSFECIRRTSFALIPRGARSIG